MDDLQNATFHEYLPNMPGWAGWYEVDGVVIAFLARDGEIVYIHDLD